MDVEILSVGEEILLGEIPDTNASHMARAMVALGLKPRHFQAVGDEIAEISAAFRLAFSRSQVVLVTGGIGPTEDDLTREGLCEAAGGIGLDFHPEVLQWMAERVGRRIEELSACNRKQAMVPHGAQILRNEWGTAPGLYLQHGGSHVFVMPGVPREMKGLLEKYVVPILREKLPGRGATRVKVLHCFGIPESNLNERIRDLMARGANPDVGTRVGYGVVSVRAVARGADEGEAQGRLDMVCAVLRERLADGIFGEDGDTLASVAARLLIEKRLTAAIAESCTGGMLSGTLTQVPGISAAFVEGLVVYSNAAKVLRASVPKEIVEAKGAVSPEVAEALAVGVRQGLAADVGIGVTGIAGPTGGTPEKPVGLVYVASSSRDGVEVLQRQLRGDRDQVRERTVQIALDLLRRTVMRL